MNRSDNLLIVTFDVSSSKLQSHVISMKHSLALNFNYKFFITFSELFCLNHKIGVMMIGYVTYGRYRRTDGVLNLLQF